MKIHQNCKEGCLLKAQHEWASACYGDCAYTYEDCGDDKMPDCDVCWDSGEVPTMGHESYLGAQMKPCPKCRGKLYGAGHGQLS